MSILIPDIDPIAINLGFISVRWYGIAYFLGILIGIFTIKRLDRKYCSFSRPDLIDSFLFYIILGVLFGGRLGYIIFYNLDFYISNPNEILKVWNGGMSFHGALIGLGFLSYFFSKKYEINFFVLTDYISFVAPIGLFFGRLANFVNGELVGRETTWEFGIMRYKGDLVRHASQLYEAFGEGLLLMVVFIFLETRFNILKSHSLITSIFLILYGIVRFFIEFFREPDEQIGLFIGVLTQGQILCLLMIISGVAIFFLKRKRGLI
jgi:phosphatidylglycerol:prolipoprotein diacylglycerol transferase